MLKWLKKKVRNWLLEDDVPISFQIEILRDGRIERVTAMKSVGLHLICQSKEGFELMIKETDTMNTKHFCKLWKHLSNGDLTWKDGTPYIP